MEISLELTKPEKKGDSWELTAIATVTEGKQKDPADADVQFYNNGRAIDSPIFTDEGRAIKEFTNLKAGNHYFEAIIVGTSKKSKRGIKLEQESPKKPSQATNFKVIKHGYEGKYSFTIMALDEKNVCVKSKIRIIDSNNPTKPIELETDENGQASYSLQFNDNERFITFVLPTTGAYQKMRLFGPWPV